MNAIVLGRVAHHTRLGLARLVDRPEHVAACLSRGGTAWQRTLLDDLLLDPLIRTEGECVILPFPQVERELIRSGHLGEGVFYGSGPNDPASPAAAVASYAHHLHLNRLVSYSAEPLDARCWIFTNGACLRSAMGLPFRPSLHFHD